MSDNKESIELISNSSIIDISENINSFENDIIFIETLEDNLSKLLGFYY